MNLSTKSMRPFIGANNYKQSIEFYNKLGFVRIPLGEKLSYYRIDNSTGFYLQNAQVKDWIENTMLFLEVENPEDWFEKIRSLQLKEQFPTVKLSPIQYLDWGKEFFLHDPSNILWHIGSFK